MIIALGGSCCSSCCSTRYSRVRCRARASDSLSPAAADVVIPHAVLAVMLALTDWLSPVLREPPAWMLRERAPGAGSTPPRGAAVRPVPRDVPSLTDRDQASEPAAPAVLVYAPETVSVTDRPIVSVSWDSTKRCSV